MTNAFYMNAFSESMITFVLYVLVMIATLAAYKLIPSRIKDFFSSSLPADDGAGTHQH